MASNLTPQPFQPVRRKSLKSGLITVGAVGKNDFPADGMLESINFQFDTIGQMTLRKGTTIVGAQIANSDTLGLYQFNANNGTSRLLSVVGTVAYYLLNNTFTPIRSGLTNGSKARFSTYLNYVFMVNGTEATLTWDGNSASFGTTNVVSAPTGKFIENFRSRMWILGNSTYPDRLFYSTLPSSVTTPLITWDQSVTTGQWIDISPSDGENGTALHRTKSALLVFKPNHIYRVYSILQTDPDPQFNVGTYSSESIVEAKNGVYFHHSTGFYRYDGAVTEISRPILDIVNAITLANYSKISGWIETDGDHICWSVGTCTVGGVSYSNLIVRYTISTQVWTHYQQPSQPLVSCAYNDGTTLFSLTGDNAGTIVKQNVGVTDNGSAISYSLIHALDNIDGLNSTTKIVESAFFMHKGMTGANVTYQTQDDILNDFTKEIGQLGDTATGFSNLDVRGENIKIRISGTSVGQPMSYQGYELLVGTTQLINFTK